MNLGADIILAISLLLLLKFSGAYIAAVWRGWRVK
jgi:hypothetical protein